MDFGLKGKVALAAASSEGIGRAVAELLAAEGADLVICSRREGPLQEALEDLERHGGRVVAVQADLTDPAHVRGEPIWRVTGMPCSACLRAKPRAIGRAPALVTSAGTWRV